MISGEFFFFGTRYRSEMRKDEMNWARAYQNYLSNFIRTGDPNGKNIMYYDESKQPCYVCIYKI